MESHVIAVGRWLVEPDAIRVLDAASASAVRERVRECAARVGLNDVAAGSLVSAASELAHNQLAHARAGHVVVRETSRAEQRGVEVVAADAGTGIVDVAKAMAGESSGRASLGIGLAAVLELSDEVDIDVRIGEGTCIWARKFAHTDERRRCVGIYGKLCAGEATSGDDAMFVRGRDGVVVGVVDGLGHGQGAREASERARDVLLSTSHLEPDAILARCDAELSGTRGAVMTVAKIDERSHEVTVAAVGNVTAQLVGPGRSTRFGGSSFVLGSRGGARRITMERQPMTPHDALVLFSDGLSSRFDISGKTELFFEHPVVIAQRLAEAHGRDNDDLTVLVFR